ncbi:sialate O-acetylesterase [Arcticibacterium luteifluviistationis]|uniref:Sialate O-acetylesterase n=2 Tax=Arcticibacterium luteifluviistationis TaxID=1784714 RepID=A0A2Z4GE10_9BACT|nr:sialate O-acetylesterase [Arcticibacterium luteifluviistationis]
MPLLSLSQNINSMNKILSLLLFFLSSTAFAQLKVANIFGDHMVLQRDKPIHVWGWNTPNEKVQVQFNGESYQTSADVDGNWSLLLGSASADLKPLTMKISDRDENVSFSDILMGEVWLCSGQSNMEWKVWNVDNAAEEVKKGNHPLIRHILIPKATAFTPEKDFADREWEVCNPKTVGDFTAVGYFFARKLSQDLGVPVGLVNSAWGGSHVETWISKSAMLTSEVLKDYAENMPTDRAASDIKMEKKTIERFHGSKDFDSTTLNEQDYLKPTYDFSDWTAIGPMGSWDWKGVPSFRGTVYIQKTLELTAEQAESISEVSFGETTGDIAFYVNGKLVYQGYHEALIKFKIPKGVWKQGENSLLVKFSANRGPGNTDLGLSYGAEKYKLSFTDSSIPLMDSDWKARPSWESSRKYMPWMNNEGTLCYNAMIAPVVGLGLKGVLWYQGESNAGRAYDYRKAFPLLINDWRDKWKEELPFFWVQLSSYGAFNDSNSGSDWAELREAQSMALKLPKTGEVVTIDIGNPKDIHPRNKQDVGLRMALSAEKVAYGKNVVFSGPTFKSMKVKGRRAVLSFDNVGGGLKVNNKYGNLEGYEIAGADKKFYFAESKIIGNTVVVSHPMVKAPMAVRYGWSNSPVDANLFNKENLPASPFRTDSWKGITEDSHFE